VCFPMLFLLCHRLDPPREHRGWRIGQWREPWGGELKGEDIDGWMIRSRISEISFSWSVPHRPSHHWNTLCLQELALVGWEREWILLRGILLRWVRDWKEEEGGFAVVPKGMKHLMRHSLMSVVSFSWGVPHRPSHHLSALFLRGWERAGWEREWILAVERGRSGRIQQTS
jgi:hypothetical protein